VPQRAAPEALAEADREGLDADAEQLRDDEVAELVQDDCRAEDEDESENPGHKGKDFFRFGPRGDPKPQKLEAPHAACARLHIASLSAARAPSNTGNDEAE
jgi:hypothetical protein